MSLPVIMRRERGGDMLAIFIDREAPRGCDLLVYSRLRGKEIGYSIAQYRKTYPLSSADRGRMKAAMEAVGYEDIEIYHRMPAGALNDG